MINIKDFVKVTEPMANTLIGTYTDKIRTIKRYRLTGLEQETRTVWLKKDYGLTDVPSLLQEYKNKADQPVPSTSLTD